MLVPQMYTAHRQPSSSKQKPPSSRSEMVKLYTLFKTQDPDQNHSLFRGSPV